MRKALFTLLVGLALAGCSSGNPTNDPKSRLIIGIEEKHDGYPVSLAIECRSPCESQAEFSAEYSSSDVLFAPMEGQDEQLVFIDVDALLEEELVFDPAAYWSEGGSLIGAILSVKVSFGEDEDKIESSWLNIEEGGLYYIGVAEIPDAQPCSVVRVSL